MVFSNFGKSCVVRKFNKESNRWILGMHNCKTKIIIRFSYGAGREARYSDIRTYRKQFVIYERLTIYARKIFALPFSVMSRKLINHSSTSCVDILSCATNNNATYSRRVQLLLFMMFGELSKFIRRLTNESPLLVSQHIPRRRKLKSSPIVSDSVEL